MKESYTQSASTTVDTFGNVEIVGAPSGWTVETTSDNGKVITAPIALWIIIFLLLGSMFVVLSSYDEEPFTSTYVGIYDDMLNIPQKALNDLSLIEVFDGGNLVNINNWISRPGYGGSFSIINNEIMVNVVSSYGGLEQPLSLQYDDIFYHYFKVKGNPNIYLGTLDRTFNLTKTNEIEIISFNAQSYQTLNNVTIRSEIAQTFYVYDVNIINLSSLGISSLTVSQMNYWFNLYQQYKSKNTQVLSFSDNLTIEQKIEVGGSGLNALIDILDVVNSTSKVTQQIMDGIKIFFTSTLQTLDRVGHDIRNIANFDNQVYSEWGYSPFAEANYNIQWWEDFKESSWLPWNWGK